MKIIITGHNGFIGKQVVALLQNTRHEILGMSRSTGFDMTDPKGYDELGDFDLLIHLAANTFIPFSFEEPGKFYQENLSGTINALEACRKQNAKIIFISSFVYGHPQYLPIDEKHLAHPANPYTWSKHLGEELCRSYHENFGIDANIVRPFNVYGPAQGGNFLVPSILAQLKTGEIKLQDARPKRDFVHVNDVAEAIVKLVDYNNPFAVFNIGSGISTAIAQIADTLSKAELISKEKIIFSNEQRPNEVLETLADISHAKVELNWEPKHNFETELIKMAKYVLGQA